MPDLEDRRPPLTPQLAMRVAVLGGDRARAVRGHLLPPVVPAGALRRPVPRPGAREPDARRAHPGAARRDRRPQRHGARRQPPGRTSCSSSRRSLPEQVDRRRRDVGPGDAASARARPEGQARRAGPAARRSPTAELAQRYRRLGRVLGMRPSTIHRRVIEQLAAAAVLGGDRPLATCRTRCSRYIKERQELFPGVDVERVFLRDYPRDDARRPAARLPSARSARRSSSSAATAASSRARSSARPASSTRTTATCAAATARRSCASTRTAASSATSRCAEREPIPGRQLRLSLDLGLQKAGQDALRGDRRRPAGRVRRDEPAQRAGLRDGLVPDASTRRSSPSRSRSRGSSSSPPRRTARRSSTARSRGLYPSGSTFKPITALAALDKGVDHARTRSINDPGCIKIGTREACNARQDRRTAPVDLRRALQVSSDVYFYTPGVDLFHVGGERAAEVGASASASGRAAGIDLPDERARPDPRARSGATESTSDERKCRKGNDGQARATSLEIRALQPRRQREPRGRPGRGRDLAAADGGRLLDASSTAAASRARTSASRSRTRPAASSSRSTRAPRARSRSTTAWRQAIMDGLRARRRRSRGGTSARRLRRLAARPPAGVRQDRHGGDVRQGRAFDQSWYVAYVPHPTQADRRRGDDRARRLRRRPRRAVRAPDAREVVRPRRERLARAGRDASVRQAAD